MVGRVAEGSAVVVMEEAEMAEEAAAGEERVGMVWEAAVRVAVARAVVA